MSERPATAGPYRHAVVGTDGSASATLAVRHAAALAAGSGASLTVVSAYTRDDPSTERVQAPAPDDVRWRLTDAAAAQGRAAAGGALARELGVEDVHVRVEPGDPAAVLLDVASDVDGDVIVVGSRGMASPARFLLGSVPNRVSHHAPCDVLIVRTAD